MYLYGSSYDDVLLLMFIWLNMHPFSYLIGSVTWLIGSQKDEKVCNSKLAPKDKGAT